jgi:DNA methylase
LRVILDHDRAVLLHGDCRRILELLPECSVDSIVTDPPYLLGFMSREWDSLPVGRAQEEWHKLWCDVALRVLKPGGHMLAFGGSRTFHRMCSAIEDSGFELRDVMMWMYGQGFPKSLDVAKQKVDDVERWRGWGTALKPAYEPIAVARKPLDGTVAENVNAWGVGGINIDGCRVGDEVRFNPPSGAPDDGSTYALGMRGKGEGTTATGRWPANVLADAEAGAMLDAQAGEVGSHGGHVECGEIGFKGGSKGASRDVAKSAGGPSRFFYCPKPSKAEKDLGLDHLPVRSGGELTDREDGSAGLNSPRAGAGRGGGQRNPHVTVKPVELMRYLCRLVTPPGGTVLDVFAGSGTTGVAALAEGLTFVGAELGGDSGEHLPALVGRIWRALGMPGTPPAIHA